MEFSKKRLLFGSLLIVAGLFLWLLLSPNLITLSGENGTFVSYLNWLGVIFCLLGVGIVIYGVGHLVSE